MKVFVLGTGGWGIALAMLLHQNGHEVTSWTYLQEECDLLHRERCNEKLLPGVVIPEGLRLRPTCPALPKRIWSCWRCRPSR